MTSILNKACHLHGLLQFFKGNIKELFLNWGIWVRYYVSFPEHWMWIQILFGCEKQNNWILHRKQINRLSVVMTAFVIWHTFSRFFFTSPFFQCKAYTSVAWKRFSKKNPTKRLFLERKPRLTELLLILARHWSPTHREDSVALTSSLTVFKMF